MATTRKIYTFRHGDVIDIEEYHDGNYGARGKPRQGKEKPTSEQMKRINAWNKAKRARQRLLEYFHPGDIFATLTYEVKNRPSDMQTAVKDFAKAIRNIRGEFKKRERELFWIRNIECGTKGAWHIHLVINEIGDTAAIIKSAWKLGGIYVSEIRLNDKIYDEDFTKLANYITKDEHTRYRKKNGEWEKPRIKEASYSTSRNMPLKKPKKKKLIRWKNEVKAKKGYYIVKIHEGINPITGYKYRRYTMVRLRKERAG